MTVKHNFVRNRYTVKNGIKKIVKIILLKNLPNEPFIDLPSLVTLSL